MELEINPAPLAECASSSTFLQSAMWGEFKSRFGWKAAAFSLVFDGSERIPLLTLARKIAKRFTLVYVPWGPAFPPNTPPSQYSDLLEKTAVGIKKHISAAHVVRFDLPWAAETCNLSAKFTKTPFDVQAPSTVIIDLTKSEDEILAQMKPKWRYNVKLGCKNVEVRREGCENLPLFYELLTETARRDKIYVHDFKYYAALFENAAADVRLYLAWKDGAPVAGVVTLFRGAEAVYLYGASSSENRNLMATYALQWRAMCDAKNAACTYYDLFGIPPTDDPHHPMAGLYKFKTGFGGKIVRRPGCYDYDYNRLFAALYRQAERLRKKLMCRAAGG